MKLKTFVIANLCAAALFADVTVSDVEGTYTAASEVKASKELKQHIDLGFANTTGNTETLNLNALYDLAFTTQGYEGRDLKVAFNTRAYITENNGVRDNEEYRANIGIEQYFINDWILYGFTSWFRNTFQNYDSRIRIGIGVGKMLFDDGKNSLKVKFGAAYNIEEYTNAQPKREFGSVTEYVEYRNKLNDISDFYVKVGAMQNMDMFDTDYEVTTVAGFNFAVAERVSLTLEGEVRYDNFPPAGFEKTDTKTIARVGYHF
ncbi:MAG: DUF481 domain-containing protein [Sulfurovum sp.]|nr:DUF481 domain-containing protein [Sulfurovum sp.]